MAIIQHSDPNQDRTKASRVTEDGGKRTLIMKGPVAEMFYKALHQLLPKDAVSEAGYSFESHDGTALVLDPNSEGGIRAEDSEDTQVVGFGQYSDQSTVQDIGEFSNLVANKRDCDELHLILLNKETNESNEKTQALAQIAASNGVMIHDTMQGFVDTVTGKTGSQADAEADMVSYSQEGVIGDVMGKLGDFVFGKDRIGNKAIRDIKAKHPSDIVPAKTIVALKEMASDKWLDAQTWTSNPVVVSKLIAFGKPEANPASALQDMQAWLAPAEKNFNNMKAAVKAQYEQVAKSLAAVSKSIETFDEGKINSACDEQVKILRQARSKNYARMKGSHVVGTIEPVTNTSDWGEFIKWLKANGKLTKAAKPLNKEQAKALIEFAIGLIDDITKEDYQFLFGFPYAENRQDYTRSYGRFLSVPKNTHESMIEFLREVDLVKNYFDATPSFIPSRSYITQSVIYTIMSWVLRSTKNKISLESIREDYGDSLTATDISEESLTALDEVGEGSTKEFIEKEKEEDLEAPPVGDSVEIQSVSTEGIGKIFEALADMFGGIERKIVIMERNCNEILRRSARKDKEAISADRRYINAQRGAALAFGSQMCEDGQMVRDKLVELELPMKLFSELGQTQFMQMARYCESTLTSLESKTWNGARQSINTLTMITDNISEQMMPVMTERGLFKNRYLPSSKLMLNDVVIFPAALGPHAYIPMIGAMRSQASRGIKGPMLSSVGEAEDIIQTLMEVNRDLGNYMKHAQSILQGSRWNLYARLRSLEAAKIVTNNNGEQYVEQLDEDSQQALMYVRGILSYLDNLSRVMYYTIYPVLEVSLDYCRVSIDNAK